MNECLIYIKNKPYKVLSEKFNQTIINKNYNRILQSLNTINFKSVNEIELDDDILKLQLLGSDGLIFEHQIQIEFC